MAIACVIVDLGPLDWLVDAWRILLGWVIIVYACARESSRVDLVECVDFVVFDGRGNLVEVRGCG